MSDFPDYEKAETKANEQWEYAGLDQLGWDSYVRNILNAALGNTVLYEPSIFITRIGAPELEELLERGVLFQVWPKGDSGNRD